MNTFCLDMYFSEPREVDWNDLEEFSIKKISVLSKNIHLNKMYYTTYASTFTFSTTFFLSISRLFYFTPCGRMHHTARRNATLEEALEISCPL
jgi:hypothetical protein